MLRLISIISNFLVIIIIAISFGSLPRTASNRRFLLEGVESMDADVAWMRFSRKRPKAVDPQCGSEALGPCAYLLGIYSHPLNFQRRALIRQTWLKYRHVLYLQACIDACYYLFASCLDDQINCVALGSGLHDVPRSLLM